MFWRFVSCVLVLSQIAEGETSSNSSQKLQVQYLKENVSEGESSELLNGRNESIYSPSSEEEFSSQEIKNQDQHLNISNYLYLLSDSENAQNGDEIAKGEGFSQSEDSRDNRNTQSVDQVNNTFLRNHSQVLDFSPPINDMQTYFLPDYWLQKNVSDGYDPKRTKKNKLVHREGEVAKSSSLKSSRNYMNPITDPLRNTETSSLINKVDYLLERNMENSHKRVGDVDRSGLFYFKEQRSNNSESPSNPSFLYDGISSTPQLTEPAKVDVGNVFKYHPSTDTKLRSDSRKRNDKDKIYRLKHLDNKKSSNHRGLQEFGEAIFSKAEEKIPVTLSEAEDRRKVTILKHKTVHSVSKEEEQETVNIHQNPVERLSEDDIVAIETQSNNNGLSKPEKQEKIGKREETIVLVEGTHIPGKNYGPEDDLFGYHSDFYENLQPDSKDNQNLEITLTNGPTVQSSHGVRQNNHGDGLSSRYFVNRPKSSRNSHPSEFKENDKFFFPPSNSPPRVTHEFRVVSVAEGEKKRNLPENLPKYQENGNNVQTAGNEQGLRHQEENQYVHLDVDPNQIYMDEKTGQLIKFVTEEEAEKLGVTAEYQVENGHEGNSAANSQKKSEQNSHYGHLEDFSASRGSKGQAIDSKIFVNNGEHKEYSELTNADFGSQLPVNKPRKGQKPQYVTVNEKSSEFYVPMKDLTSKSVSVSNSVSYEGSHGVQEDQGSYVVPGHSEGSRGKKPQFVTINEKNSQFFLPEKDVTTKSNFRSASYEGIRGVQNDQGNYDVSGHSGGSHGVQEDQGSFVVPSHSEGSRGKKPQFVTINEKNSQFFLPEKDVTTKSNFRSASYEGIRGVQKDQGNYDVSGHSGGSHGVQEDQGSFVVPSHSEGSRGKKPQFVTINEKSSQFFLPEKDITTKSNFRSSSYEGSRGVQKDQGNYDVSGHSGGTSGTEYVVLCPETGSHAQHNQDYGKKMNFGSLGGTVTNPQSSKNDYHNNNFKGLGDTAIEYEDDNGYKTSNDGLNHSENEDTYSEDNFDTHGGNRENVGNFKGSTEGLHDTSDHGLLYDSQTGGQSVKTDNIGNFKGIPGELENAQGHGVLYELQTGGKLSKTDHTEIPLYKENMQLYKKDTESSTSSFPSKGDAVSTVYFTMVHHKAKNSRNPKRKKQNQNYIKFETPQNNFKGTTQKLNSGLDMNSIHDHENFRVSLQNLYGHNGGSMSLGKTQSSNNQNSGYSKGNNNYLLPTGVDFKGKQLYEEVNLSPPQNSVKGSTESYKGNNIKSGFNSQNSGGYSSGVSGSGKGKHGGYKSNGITYSSLNENLQPNSHHMFQNKFAGLNNVHQSEGPVEYVIVEEDDNNYESQGLTGITEDPFLLEYEKYRKGNNGDLTSTNLLGHQPYEIKGSTTYSMEPNVRFIVDGGKDTANRLRRLAATGFHMARGVLPNFPISRPRSVKGNVNFGLEINKRRGPAIISQLL